MKADHRRFEKAAQKIIDVMSDGRITSHDMIYVAFYTVANAYPVDPVLDRLIEFAEQVKWERERMNNAKQYDQYTLF